MFTQTGSQSEQSHYTRLYSCKHFRNRVIKLQTLCQKLNIDAILLAIGMDTFHDEEMKKLQNWLLFGLSSSDINGSTPSDCYSESFFVISKDSFQAFTNSSGFKELSNLITLLTNCNIYTITKADENESERQEVIKVAKFYEMIHDKKAIGMPVRKLTNNDYIPNESQLIEKWPLIQAYGLDVVGNGFFTLKHQFHNLRDEMIKMYAEYDSFATFRIVFDEIDRFNQHYYDNFFTINKDTPLKRLERTEQDLIDGFWLRSEFSLLTRKGTHCPSLEDDGLPLTRALYGTNTNKPYKELSNKEERLYKYNQVDEKDSVLHFTFEFTEKNTNIRFARTFFLSNLSQHYMEGYYFSDDEEERKSNSNGKVNELNTKVLFNAYVSLILTFQNISEQFMRHQITNEEAQSASYGQFAKLFVSRSGEQDLNKLLKNGKDDFTLVIKAFNTFGEEVPMQTLDKKLINIRMQVSNITSPHDQSELGAIVFADTYLSLDRDTFINISKHVPNLEFWYTSNKHYEFLPAHIQTEKNLQCEQLGERQNYFQDLQGFMPVKESLSELFSDINLLGKLVFYENGFIFVDQKLNSFVLSYADIEHINFYVADGYWMEVKSRQQHTLPANILCGDTFYIKITQAIFNEKFKLLQQIQESKYPDTLKIEKKYQTCDFIQNSLSFKNYEINKKYNKFMSCNYLNFSFQEAHYRELLEFQSIGEFNLVRSKEFISFSSFHKVYQEAQQKIPYGNYAQMLIDKLKIQILNTQNQNKNNVIIISGIPGSGKGKLAEYLAKQFNNEGLSAVAFKMPTVQDTIKFSTQKYIQAMTQFKHSEAGNKVILSVLPSYNHLKKVIFELKKSQEYSELFEIRFIITKVHARNFYMNKNRNTFQFLIENCMKGVTQAVIFEKSNVNPNELQIMQKCLENANFESNILPTQSRTFKLDDLGKILLNNHDKLNILYNKYFYGFEKEGKSAYFQEKTVVGGYYQYRYPFKEELLQQTIMMALNTPINSPQQILDNLPQAHEEKIREKEDKENLIKKQMENMNKEEQRKMERELKRQKKIEADLEPERLLQEEMDIAKRRVGSNDLYMERIRGYVMVEGKEEEQDYELICNFNELSLKPMKNQNNRLKPEELGLLIYGKNLNEALIKEVMKTCRSQLHKKRTLKTRETITEEEIEMLKDKFVSQMLPEGWFFNGYFYLNHDGDKSFVHPNLEVIIKQYLDEQNGEIGDYNREVQKEWRNDKQKYDTAGVQ